MGDLSLALDPHPPPDTPTVTEALDLSTTEGDLGESFTPAAAVNGQEGGPPGNSQQDVKATLTGEDPSESECKFLSV